MRTLFHETAGTERVTERQPGGTIKGRYSAVGDVYCAVGEDGASRALFIPDNGSVLFWQEGRAGGIFSRLSVVVGVFHLGGGSTR